MRKLTTNEKLDKVLRALNDAHKDSGKSPQRASLHPELLNRREIFNHSYDFDKNSIDFSEIHLILDYLLDEGYIKSLRHEDETKYRITYKGKIFIEKNGFRGKARKELNHRVMQSFGQVLLVLGTFLAGLYGLIEVVKLLFKIKTI